MGQRAISEREAERVLAHYHTGYTDEDGNPIYVGNPGGRRVVVVVSLGTDPPHIITI